MSDGEAGVGAYLTALTDDAARRALSDLRARIRALVPDATERIAYRVPAFFQDGALVSYGARPKHCTPERPLSDRVLELVVRERLAENAARHGG